MATNVELERQIKDLRDELTTLKQNLKSFFNSREFQTGVGAAWTRLVANTEPVNAAVLAAKLNEAAPTPQSAALTAADITDMATELGVTVPLSAKDSLQFAKDAVKAAQDKDKDKD